MMTANEQALINHCRQFGAQTIVKKTEAGRWVVTFRDLSLPKVYATQKAANEAATAWWIEKKRRNATR